jgi:hypothetical protein
MKTYKIRKFQNGKNKKGDPFINYSLTIPSNVAESLPEDITFSCELTEDGILFRPASPESESVNLPSWAEKNGNGNGASVAASSGKPKAKATRARPAAAKKGARKRPGARA